MGQKKRGRGWIDTPSSWGGGFGGFPKPRPSDRFSLGLWCRGCGHPIRDDDNASLVVGNAAWHRGCPLTRNHAVPVGQTRAPSGPCPTCNVLLPATGRCDQCN